MAGAFAVWLAGFELSEQERVAGLFRDAVVRGAADTEGRLEGLRTLLVVRWMDSGDGERAFYRRVMGRLPELRAALLGEGRRWG